MNLLEIASVEDKAMIRGTLDDGWLRCQLLVDAIGCGVELNISKVARELGLSRNRATKFLNEARAKLRTKSMSETGTSAEEILAEMRYLAEKLDFMAKQLREINQNLLKLKDAASAPEASENCRR